MGSGHGCAKPRMRRSAFLSSPPSDLHLELKGPLPGGFPFSYNCPVTSFMSFVKCHSSPLTTPPKGTLAPVGSAPSPALYRFPSCIIFLHDNTLRFSSWSVPHTDHERDGNRDYCTLCLLLCSLPLECAQRAAVQ